jgi:hypothetical protein
VWIASRYAAGASGSIGRVAPSAVASGSALVRCIRMKNIGTTTVGLKISPQKHFAILVLPRRWGNALASAETCSFVSGPHGRRLAGALPAVEPARKRRCALFRRGKCLTAKLRTTRMKHSSKTLGSRLRQRQRCSYHSSAECLASLSWRAFGIAAADPLSPARRSRASQGMLSCSSSRGLTSSCRRGSFCQQLFHADVQQSVSENGCTKEVPLVLRGQNTED